MSTPFTPDLLCPTSDLCLAEVIQILDKDFKRKVDEGWYKNWYKDRINLQYKTDNDIGNSLVALRHEVKEHYLALGWGSVVIKTSEEDGERSGLVGIHLVKKSTSNTLTVETDQSILDWLQAQLKTIDKALAAIDNCEATQDNSSVETMFKLSNRALNEVHGELHRKIVAIKSP